MASSFSPQLFSGCPGPRFTIMTVCRVFLKNGMLSDLAYLSYKTHSLLQTENKEKGIFVC